MEHLGKKAHKEKHIQETIEEKRVGSRYNARLLLKRLRRCTKKKHAQERRLHEQGTFMAKLLQLTPHETV